MQQPTLFDLPDPPDVPDRAARDVAVDPSNDVVLEASAGTGKTRVLVDRYVALVEGGVDPRHILAITFTRKAAAEMRDRALSTLRRGAGSGAWARLRDRVADIQISTIDAFCFNLLREFPLEAGVEPDFQIADETEMARFANEALDQALHVSRLLLPEDECLRLLFTRIRPTVLREAVAGLLDRRHVAGPAVADVVRRGGVLSAEEAARRFVDRLRAVLAPVRAAILDDGPRRAPEFSWLHRDLSDLDEPGADRPARVLQLRRRLERYCLTKDGKPRQRLGARIADFVSRAAYERHLSAFHAFNVAVFAELNRLQADVDVLVTRGLQRFLRIAVDRYERLLGEHALLDFAGMLERAVALVSRQEEFARSRLKLQARFHHLLLDEFQDTSRLQWRLVEALVAAWGEGEGAADAPTSIFVVGDRKQSIYRFRHADVTLLDEAARLVQALRPNPRTRQALTTSFRAVPGLLAFVNALSASLAVPSDLPEAFTYRDTDRFPVAPGGAAASAGADPVLGLVAEATIEHAAAAVAAEVRRLLDEGTVRDPAGAPRPTRPDDIAILFRARVGHQYFEEALDTHGIQSYVYKGLGFFDAPEVQDLQALMRYLANPESDLRAAEFLRSRLVRLSDDALLTIAPGLAGVLAGRTPVPAHLPALDRDLLGMAIAATGRWRALSDRLAPSALLDLALAETAYAREMKGRRLDQARENVKKVRAVVRRVEARGYATIGRIAEYFQTLESGDEANAIVGARGCVNLMTIHAAKGLEFPVVFVVNLDGPSRGTAQGLSVIERGPDGAPEVSYGSSEATRLEDAREDAELRRLSYVAVTRARDRLYLSGRMSENGELKQPPRSLARLLPPSLSDAFRAAAASPEIDKVDWVSPEGRFPFRVCRPPSGEAQPRPATSGAAVVSADRREIGVDERPHVGAAPGEDASASEREAPSRPDQPAEERRLVGSLVHRLIRHAALRGGEIDPAAALAGLVRPEDLADVRDLPRLERNAIDLFEKLAGQPAWLALRAEGEAFFEVPFSAVFPERPGETVRGVADCLVVRPDGRATVVEFKTGRPRPSHRDQARIYALAVGLTLDRPDTDVLLVYPDGSVRYTQDGLAPNGQP
jgi:ATP-dependent helicase/nuclease subunit A